MFKELNIMRVFFESPTRDFNVREIARILKIAPATASKELKKLAKSSLLKEEKKRGFNLYKSYIENEFYGDFKSFYNIRKLRDSGFIKRINEFYLKPTIVLFGSSVHGLDTETSDFDILILSEKTSNFPDLKIFEKKLNRKVQLFVVKDIKDLKNKFLINNILNGVTLQGEIKWI